MLVEHNPVNKTMPIRLWEDLMLPYLQLQFGTDLVLGRNSIAFF